MRNFLLIVSLLYLSNLAFSQDIITLKNGNTIKAKVLQVGAKKVTYTRFEETSGKIYTINISKIFIIIFEKKNEKYLKSTPTTTTGQ